MLFRANGVFRRDLRVGESGSGLGDLTVERDAIIGDDITVGDDATIGGDVVAGGIVSGLMALLFNNSPTADANETLFDGFQSSPIRYYTGSTGALQTTLPTTSSVYHWYLLCNAQTTTRNVNDEATGLNLSLGTLNWCIVLKVASLNAWKVIAKGTFIDFA